jgi:hypothetical protein
MPHGHGTLVAELNDALTRQRYNRVAVHNYCRNAGYFLAYLTARKVALEAVTPADVTNYLRFAVRQFRKRHGRAPARYWIGIPRSGIHALLKLALKRWPPEPAAAPGGLLCREVCEQYQTWLREERGLATGFGRRLAVGSSKFLCLAHQAFERQFCRPDRPRSRYLHGHAGSRADAETFERCRRAASVAAETSSQDRSHRGRSLPARYCSAALCL